MSDRWSAKQVARLLSLVEDELRSSQDRLSRLPVAVALVSPSLRVVAANRAFQELFGIRLAEGALPIEMISVEGLRDASHLVLSGAPSRAWLARNAPTSTGERTLWIALEPSRLWHEAAQPHLLVVASDVTNLVAETRRDVQAARGPAEWLDLLPALVWRLDPSTMRFTELSELAATRLGLPTQHWRVDAKFWSDRIHPDDSLRVQGLYQSALGGVPLASCDYRAVAASGETRWLRDLVRFARDQNGNVTVVEGITLDVTASRRISESHHQARKVQALTRLTARVVREGADMLTVLGCNSEELLNGLPPQHALRANVQQMLQAYYRLSALLAALAPVEARPQPMLHSFVLDKFLAGLQDSLQSVVRSDVDLTLNLGVGAAAIEVDQPRLREIIGTLVRRASDRVGKGGSITISTRVEEVAAAPANCEFPIAPGAVVAIRICDNGPLLSQKELDRIFEPAETPKEVSYNLAVMFLTIRDNGGDLSVLCDRNQGTCFKIIFPRVAWTN